MKDPSSEILSAFATLLASISYNSKAWHIYTKRPAQGKKNYIYISDLQLTDSSDQDHNITQGLINIDVSVINDKHAKTIANSLSNSIFQAAIRQGLTMTNFTIVVEPYLNNTIVSKEFGDQYIKPIQLTFSVQEK